MARHLLGLFFSLLVLSACTQAPPSGVTPAGQSVPTLVAQTLMALSATPAAPAAATPTPAAPLPLPSPVAPSPTLTPQPLAPTAAPAAQPTPTAQPTAQPAPAQAASQPGCIDKAAYYGDVTIPDDTLLDMNTDFVKTWRIKNEGTCTWDGYSLVFAGGSPLNGPQANPLPKTAPGSIIEISVKLRTPNQGGTYVSDWEFQKPGGKRFGVNAGGVDKIWTKIKVDWGAGTAPTATPSSTNASNTSTAACAVERNAGYEAQILSSINNARAAKSLPALKLQSQLSAAAFAHSSDMACKNFVDHTGSDGSLWYQRVKAAGYAYSYASENIYSGDPTFGGDANGAFTWWMNSQVHRDNILSTKISEIGIAYAYYSKATYKGYYTLVFARP